MRVAQSAAVGQLVLGHVLLLPVVSDAQSNALVRLVHKYPHHFLHKFVQERLNDHRKRPMITAAGLLLEYILAANGSYFNNP